MSTGQNLEAPVCPHCGEFIPNRILSEQIADTRDDLYVQCLTEDCAGELHVARDQQSQGLRSDVNSGHQTPHAAGSPA